MAMQLKALQSTSCSFNRYRARQCRLKSALVPKHRALHAIRKGSRLAAQGAATLDRSDQRSASSEAGQT